MPSVDHPEGWPLWAAPDFVDPFDDEDRAVQRAAEMTEIGHQETLDAADDAFCDEINSHYLYNDGTESRPR